MKYIEVNTIITPNSETAADLAAGVLGTIGFESFLNTDEGLLAYIPESLYDETAITDLLTDFPLSGTKITFTSRAVADENWNAEWEKKHFTPIIIGDQCVIHSTNHADIPAVKYDILINPRMAFGSGHHETTYLILDELLHSDVQDKSVLDMGCGTAVLAILAQMRGAKSITAIDIDEWAYNNAIENVKLNKTTDIEILLGGSELLKNRKFDLVIANINRNILLKDIHAYASCLQSGDELLMSGFYVEDIPVIEQKALTYGLKFVRYTEKNHWVVTRFIKK